MRILVWLLRAFIFFSLFAFSLNNLHTATLHWYFGQSWSAPMVIVVLVAFGAGAAFGVLAMTPTWWRQRQRAQQVQQPTSVGHQTAHAPSPPAPVMSDGI
ncbi:MAG: LapA family protein [Ideonella sp.]|nr:LapA family protein [Ideonella sp.]